MLKKNLEQREKPELIAIITHMLRQEPELQWLLATPLPTASSQQASIDPEVYRLQVLAAMSAGDYQRKRGEVQRRLTAIKTIANEFAAQELYGEEGNPEMRLRVIRVLFAIYRFYTESGMDLDEDIPGLLAGNTTPEERRVIASWTRDALTHKAAWSSNERYEVLLAALERGKR